MMYVTHKGIEVAGEYLPVGTLTEAIPADAIPWLLEIGAIEQVDAPAPKTKKGGK